MVDHYRLRVADDRRATIRKVYLSSLEAIECTDLVSCEDLEKLGAVKEEKVDLYDSMQPDFDELEKMHKRRMSASAEAEKYLKQ